MMKCRIPFFMDEMESFDVTIVHIEEGAG